MTRRLGAFFVALAIVFVIPTVSSAQCTRSGLLRRDAITATSGVLARAVSATRFAQTRGSNIFDYTARDITVCLDSLPFLEPFVTVTDHKLGLALVRVGMVSNSAYPRSYNDGALWAGKGANALVSAGVEGRWRFLTAALAPEYVYQQNSDYDFVRASFIGRSPYTNPYHRIDLPYRMGEESFGTFDPGQSFVRAELGPVQAAVSNENLWLGANQVYPILLSNTAPGFPHLRIGTSRPIDLAIVNAELNVFWGAVSESDYFDGDDSNNSHLFTGSSIVLEPKFLRGFHFGFARVLHDTSSVKGQDAGFFLERVIELPLFVRGGNRAGNAIGALFFRWVLPESGFEAYGEWSREDTPYNLADLLREPDWTQAYGAGLQKTFVTPRKLVRVYGELIHLGATAATIRTARGPFTTYTHGEAIHGHTNRGQMLGSPTGLGSDAQRIGADWFSKGSVTSGFVERVRYDDDSYYNIFARRYGEARHDVEATIGAKHVRWWNDIELTAAATFSRRYDREFVSLQTGAPIMIESNVSLQLFGKWIPRNPLID